MEMRFKRVYIVILLGLFVSCKGNSEEKEAENLRATQKKDSIFITISNAWQFSNNTFNPATQSIIDQWNEWRNFQSELLQKPKSTIGAFKQKSKAITAKAEQLNKNIPAIFNTPQIISRITTLITKIKSLEMFITLDAIPEKKVVSLITDINTEIGALQDQMQVITKKANTHLEEGEAKMLKLLRADSLKVKPTSREFFR